MARYIDADVLKRNIRINLMPNVDVDGTVTVENAERYFLNLIDKTSTADVVEVKHGEWIEKEYSYFCSECDSENCYAFCENTKNFTDYYCPQCGAKMDGGKANDL